jgi:peptidoglycan/LPS O-acetylase OafA/YrhL
LVYQPAGDANYRKIHINKSSQRRKLDQMNHGHRNLNLDWVRGISALVVSAGHTRNALLPDFADLPHHGLLETLVYFSTGFGHAAVLVFFALSGYLVGGSILNNKAAFDWQNYFISRYTRLWVVLLPALVWTWLIDQQTQFLEPQLLQGRVTQNWHSLPAPGEYSATLSTFLLNLLFQQTVTSPVFGSNGPLWSLANEAWYYLLFPLLAVPLVHRRWGLTFICWPLAGVVLAHMPTNMLLLLPIWVCGAILRKLPKDLLTGRWGFGLITATAFFFVLVAYKKFGQARFDGHTWDTLIGLSFILWAAYLIQNTGSGHDTFLGKIAARLSDFSYSLYLVHMPMAVFFGAILSMPEKRPGSTGDFLIFAAVFALELIFAYVFWRIFERRTPAIKDWLIKKARDISSFPRWR